MGADQAPEPYVDSRLPFRHPASCAIPRDRRWLALASHVRLVRSRVIFWASSDMHGFDQVASAWRGVRLLICPRCSIGRSRIQPLARVPSPGIFLAERLLFACPFDSKSPLPLACMPGLRLPARRPVPPGTHSPLAVWVERERMIISS